MAPVFSAMGAGHAAMLIIWNALQLLGCAGCAYSFISEGPGTSLMPTAALTATGWIWYFVSPSAVAALGSGTATVLQHMLPMVSTGITCLIWLMWGDMPHELLPSTFYESNSFKLFGRDFTIYKTIDDNKNEESVLEAAAQLVGAAAMGVLFGLLIGAATAPALHKLGVLQSYWPPDPIPGYEPMEALAPLNSPRRRAAASASFTPAVAITRTASAFCEALGDELLFRSVLYRIMAVTLVAKKEDEAHASLEFVPLVVVSSLSACKFLGHRGEWVYGFLLGVMLQCELAVWGSVLPCVVSHGVALLCRDALRAARPVPKPVGFSRGDGGGDEASAGADGAIQMSELHMT